jgi:hypothetical protein
VHTHVGLTTTWEPGSQWLRVALLVVSCAWVLDNACVDRGDASALIASGAHLRVVQELLGHSSYGITAEVYAYVNVE